MLSLLCAYLCNKSQKVHINNYLADNRITNSNVPQGSILGSLPFLPYINNLPDSPTHADSLLWAVDSFQLLSDTHTIYFKLNKD